MFPSSLSFAAILFTLATAAAVPLPGLSREEEPAPDAAGEKPAGPDIPALRKLADGGDAAAQLQLADLIFAGSIKGANPEEAAALHRTRRRHRAR